jgi:phosphoribosylamine--glycine ligase
MNILIIGQGGREHALGWKLAQSSRVERLYFASGNSGTAQIGENIDLDFSNPEQVIRIARDKAIELVIFGKFGFIQQGVSDVFLKEGIKVFGPSRLAGEIEGSKIFSKRLMKDLGVPCSEFVSFFDYSAASEYVEQSDFPLVIKTDIPVAGIGVEIVFDVLSAQKFLKKIFIEKRMGDTGSGVIIEKFLEGIEVSVHAFCDGTNAVMMPFSQDHKRLFDGDKGVNTFGIGAVAPVPSLSNELLEDIRQRMVLPILKALQEDGRPFVGVMYPGIMITQDGWRVLEINARFGDPEAQCYMRLLESDLLDIKLACIDGRLNEKEIHWSKDFVCSLVLAVNGYPDALVTGKPIFGLLDNQSENDHIIVFHNETALEDGNVMTVGHRAVTITSKAETLQKAITSAYDVAENIQFEGKYFRKDIGAKALHYV